MITLPEILAPAGSPETFMAGLDAGADAFYLGAPDFNARKRAKNFTRDELEQAVALAHSREKRIYIALNTLVTDSEIPALTDLLVFLDRIRVDAVIVQDLGVLDIIHRHFPRLRIHASTQLFCHNSLQAAFLKKAGVSRIVLARELSLDEIRAIKTAVPLEYEFFIHGALCFSFSGACLCSSYLYGASGNRGECRQVCRHLFSHQGREDYPFSMKDLNTADILPELLSLNPASLKIEGRLKNADYVTKTVSLYRRLLNTWVETGRLPDKIESLEGQRNFTTGYFKNADYASITEQEKQGILGVDIGTADIKKAGEVIMRVSRPLSKGARLRLMDGKGRVSCEGTLLRFGTTRFAKGLEICWYLPEAVPVKEPLKVLLMGSTNPRDHKRIFRHSLETARSIPLTVSLFWKENVLTVLASAEPFVMDHSMEYPLTLEPSRGEAGVFEAKLMELFSETGGLPFSVDSVDIQVPGNLFGRLSEVKRIRRTAYEAIFALYEQVRESEGPARIKAIVQEQMEFHKNGNRDKPDTLIYAADDTCLSVEAKQTVLETLLGQIPDFEKWGNACLLLPAFVAQEKVGEFEQWVKALKAKGFKYFAAGAYGMLPAIVASENRVITGPYVYCANSFALQFLLKQGAKGCILPPDMTDTVLEPLTRQEHVFRLEQYPKELFVTRLRLPDMEYTHKGSVYRVSHRNGYDVLLG